MAYEKGSYLKELRQEHAEKRHEERRDPLCPVCQNLENEELSRDEGFSSNAEREEWISQQCNQYDPELEASIAQVFVDDHQRGKHTKYPDRNCPVCFEIHGIKNI